MTDISQQKRVIVAVGLCIPGTGFTRVFDTLFYLLGNVFDIHWLGIAYRGPVIRTRNYTLHPNNRSGGDMFGTYGSARLARELHADIVFFINDVWIFKNYREAHQGHEWHTIAYVPIDGIITDPGVLRDMAWLDHIVAYHPHSGKQFLSGFDDLLTQGVIKSQPQISAIFHGVDTTVFAVPTDADDHLEWRVPIKRALFGKLDDWQSAMFLLNANRFNERKDLHTTIAGFARAITLTLRPLYLCLHVPGIESFQRAMLESWIEEFGCADRVIINPIADNTYVSELQLAELYRACDIGVSTTLGEGWGLVSFEHAACGAVQILPRHAALEEIWHDAAEYITLTESVTLPSNPFQMHRTSASHLASVIAHLCNHPEYLMERSRACFDHTQHNTFNWEIIAQLWKDLLMQSQKEEA